MKILLLKIIAVSFLLGAFGLTSNAQTIPAGQLQYNPWTKDQLMQPSALAEMIKKGKKIHIYNIGVVDDIKGAINVGAASKKDKLDKFKMILKNLPKNEKLVVYCGCCPMDKCPNIRPAFKLLKEQQFKNAYLLNLTVNLKTEWIDKGYPLAKDTK